MIGVEEKRGASGYRRWEFPTYIDYLAYQRQRASRTKRNTLLYGAYRRRLISLLREHPANIRSVLCLGARDAREVQDFLDAEFVAEGIDLFEDRLIRLCDMSDLDGSPYFCDRSYDAFLFVHSLQHCLDFPGFCLRSLPHCRSLIAVAIPLRHAADATAWECVAFDLQRPGAPTSAFESLFEGFELLHREVLDQTLLFLMRRKTAPSPLSCRQTAPRNAIPFFNVLVANRLPYADHLRMDLERMLRAQVENSLEVGWRASEMRLVTNFPFEHCGVSASVVDLNLHCPRGSKMFAVDQILRSGLPERAILWAHDLDCWQNDWFDPPEFTDVGACEYSRPKFNGGSVFWRPHGRDIAAEIVRRLNVEQAEREEPTINGVLRDRRYRERVTVLNPTYNVGCSGFHERWARSVKPVRACHFHPRNRLAWATHVLNRHRLPERSASLRLENLLRRWYPGLPATFIP